MNTVRIQPGLENHEVQLLRERLAIAEEQLGALQRGTVDALVVQGPDGPRIYTLQSADHPYRLFVEQMREAALTLGRNGRILYCNARFRDLIGLPEKRLLGALLRDFIEPEERGMIDGLIAELPSRTERFKSMLVSGTQSLPVQITASALDTDDFRGLCVIITDLREFYRHQGVAASERVNRTILDQASDAMLICGPDGRVRRANRAAVHLFSESVVGRNLRAVCGSQLDCNELFASRTQQRGVLNWLSAQDGRKVHLLVNATALEDIEGGDLGYVVSFTDVTSLKNAENRLREADRRKDEFLAMLAHEFRNPLAPIRNAVEILRLQNPGDDQLERTRSMIERQVTHLVHLVDDLLDVSRITRGKVKLRREPVDVASVLSGGAELARPLIDARHHRLAVTPPPPGARVLGDATRLVQVVANLLNNAAKYTEEGGTIALEAECDGDGIVLRVRDNGIGIAADLLPHVFELFTQADRNLDREQGGLGIGLSLVRHLVELHGGKAEARSEGLHCGSEFLVRLPLLREPAQPPAAPPPARAAPAGAVRRVLIVDDNADVASSVATLLRLRGHEVSIAHDGAGALSQIAEYKPQVVLLDIGLPGMNGYEVAHRMRELPGREQMRIVAMTGYGQTNDRERALRSGFDHHLVKPAAPDALYAIIEGPEPAHATAAGS
jgi:PAS domain S-box-containing protein